MNRKVTRYREKSILVLFALLLLCAPVGAHEWETTVVDGNPDGGTGGKFTSVAVHTDGSVHITDYNETLYALQYSTNASGSWTNEIVDAHPSVGKFNSLALDGNGKAHISYYDQENQALKYATNAPGSWAVTTVAAAVGEWNSDPNSGDYMPTSIAVDGNGSVHIGYYNANNQDLEYAKNTSGSWQLYTVDTTDNVGMHCSLALDGNGKVHMSYYYTDGSTGMNGTTGRLKYATNAPGTWITDSVDTSGTFTGWYTSIALDGSGYAHISYFDKAADALKYATNASGPWFTEYADNGADSVGYYSSLALGGDGKAHISYYDLTNKDLKYATDASGSWSTETVDYVEYVGEYTSLALDGSGNVHISYYAGTPYYALKYAAGMLGSWTLRTLDSASMTGTYTSLGLDGSGSPHILYYDNDTAYPKVATYASGNWSTETVGSWVDIGTYGSIAVETNGNAHVVCYDAAYEVPLYATDAPGYWSAWTDVESNYFMGLGQFNSLALDSGGYAHAAYYGACEGVLRYATNAPLGSWNAELVDGGTDVGQYASLALDDSGHAHVAYYDVTNANLRYATNKNGSWEPEVVDSTGDVGSYASLALDGGGTARISYYDATNGNLKYAEGLPGAWTLETVDTAGNVGSWSSLALDAQGHVHISYWDETNRTLKHATNASGSWAVETVSDRPQGSGTYTSIACRADGSIHISHHGDDGTLLFSFLPDPTLITLVDFCALPDGNGIKVQWKTASEIDNAGFHLWRAKAEWGAYERITHALVPTKGSPTQGADYIFEDKTVEPGRTYFYKLEDVDTDGNSTYYGPKSSWSGVVNIQVNGQDGPVNLPAGTPVEVRVRANLEDSSDRCKEWWICCNTPFGWFSLGDSGNWAPGIHPCTAIPPVTAWDLEVLNQALPAGDYTFYVATDKTADKSPRPDCLDTVLLTVQ